MKLTPKVFLPWVIIIWILGGVTFPGYGYSVLTHQAIIDVSWSKSLEPLLKKRFPNATEEELRKAHAHAYGGAIIQDMGYYPFGSKFFTNLVHYVRTGDFVQNLIAESQNLEEYAFALGALAHYYADNYGHSIATNKSVPLVYPELKAEFGNTITYEEDPIAHVKMEFGFDVLQVARGNYAPEAYQKFIGFDVSKEVLERAFRKTYGLELKEQFVSLDLAINTYRRSVSTIIPDLTKAAWSMKRNDIQEAKPGITRRNYLYRLSKADFQKQWGKDYQKPNVWQQFLSWTFRILPKVGPQRTFAFKPPTPEAEKLFMESFMTTVDNYTTGLNQVRAKTLKLENTDFDTGSKSEPGSYKKADEAYDQLVLKLAKNDFKEISQPLRQNILRYYDRTPKPDANAKEEKNRDEIQEALQVLRAE
ncbi:zinc dependent phospholipase C family protein [Adhaeribacter aquaticus]|uniref:zinc dependent phospholipase C family protein n=1 Tax=Adhaeribacter aquaticus TaxID=299567 RepID=UPI00041FBA61|nr:zinc dependent phospholipase C family protein [Adhaeribacter aquaticus]